MKLLTGFICSTFLSLLSFSVAAMPFSNGGFSLGSSSWSDASGGGSLDLSDGYAQLDTGLGTDPFSSVLVQGDDGSFSFIEPIELGVSDKFLNLDVQFIDLGIDQAETVGQFSDYLSIALYDELDNSLDLIFDPSVNSKLALGWHRLHFDVSALSGRTVALSFELSDENDGRNSRVMLDNIIFANAPISSAIPIPAVLWLLLLGVILIWVSKREKFEKDNALM